MYGIWICEGINLTDGNWDCNGGVIFFTSDIGVARAQKSEYDINCVVREFLVNGKPGTVIIDNQVMEGNMRPVPANDECRTEMRDGKEVYIGGIRDGQVVVKETEGGKDE